MSNQLDFFIDEPECEEAIFEFYLEHYHFIKSITVKSITFYNSWWTGDFFESKVLLMNLALAGKTINWEEIQLDRHYSLSDFCHYHNKFLKKRDRDHVKLHCENNYLVIELLEDKEFKLWEYDPKDDIEYRIRKEWFGFKQDQFYKKGKYYSTKPLLFYVTDIFLRCNIVNQEHTFYNRKHSDILCSIPVDDGDQIKLQRYEPNSCTRRVDKATNHLKFQITDENGKVVNFRGTSVLIHFTLETNRLDLSSI